MMNDESGKIIYELSLSSLTTQASIAFVRARKSPFFSGSVPLIHHS